jgi:hypothetical protein
VAVTTTLIGQPAANIPMTGKDDWRNRHAAGCRITRVRAKKNNDVTFFSRREGRLDQPP